MHHIDNSYHTKNIRSTVSIALCTFNGQEYIEDQVNSILKQTQKPDEIVVCDDRSTDHTRKIIRDIASKSIVPIRLYHNRVNLGYVKNFEKAISLCRGDIIFLSDQDDVWQPEKVEIMKKTLTEDARIKFVYSDAIIVDENLKPSGLTIFSSRQNTQLDKGQNRPLIGVLLSPNLKGCLVAFKSDLVPSLLPIPENAKELGWGHDHWFAVIAHATNRVHVVNHTLMAYRCHSKNYGQDCIRQVQPVSIFTKFKLLLSSISKRNMSKSKKDLKINRLNLLLIRLYEIQSNDTITLNNDQTLTSYIAACEDYISAIEKRWHLQQLSLWQRKHFILLLINKGWYKKYFSGMKSIARDALLN